MARSNADLLALKSELTNDPLALGLTTLAADDEANANKLNLVRDTIQVDRQSVPASEILKAIDADEFIALSVGQRQYVEMVISLSSVNPQNGGEIREALLQFFSAQSETRASFQLLLTEAASRITQLFKAGTLQQGGIVTPSDMAQARNAV
jgi:hypothetical protein